MEKEETFLDFMMEQLKKSEAADNVPWPPLCRVDGYVHNNRTRMSGGYYCRDCETFFPKAGKTYRRTEYLTDLWMALHNINAHRLQAKPPLPIIQEVNDMRDKIGIGKPSPDNYEKLIAEAEAMLKKHGSHPEAAIRVLGGP